MAPSLPWQPSDRTNPSDVASVNYGGDLHLYAQGFRESAESLIELMRTRGHSQDLLVYPIVQNLRHAMELLLKQVIRAARRLLGEAGDFPDSHRLSDLWRTCEPLLKRIWPADGEAFRTVERAALGLSMLDPEGEAFRYPVTAKKSGRRGDTLPPELQNLDVGALHSDVSRALDLLDGADTGIDSYLEAQADMRAEARAIEREMQREYRNGL